MKAIPQYPEYLASKDGHVYKASNHKQIGKCVDSTTGYYRTSLKIGPHKYKHFYIHRLIATTFLDNPNNYPEVNHIDGNKLNNKVDNLEWVTYSENILHALENGLNNRRKEVLCEETGKKYKSVTEAAKANGIGRTALSECLSGRNKTCQHKHWKYI